MKRTHFVRIVLCSIMTIFIIKSASVRCALDNYNLAKMTIEAKELGVLGIGEVAHSMNMYMIFWNYSIALFCIIVLFMVFGFPSDIMPKWMTMIKKVYKNRDEGYTVPSENK